MSSGGVRGWPRRISSSRCGDDASARGSRATDDADSGPGYLERGRSVEAGYLSTPFAGDVELSMRAG